MNTTTLNFQVTPSRAAPRAAALIGNAFASVLSAVGVAQDPAKRAALRDARRARALAAEWARNDPRSAADLTAAIDRFEAQNGL